MALITENRFKPLTLNYPAKISQKKSITLLAWLICGLGAMFYCYEYFLRISPSVMTHELMSEYHLTGVQVGNLSAFYYHAYVPMQILVGLLMDRYGPRRLLTLACVFCAGGTFLFASGESLFLAEMGRFMVGLGSAFAFVGALKLATIWLPPNRFALVSGIILCLGMIGAMLGDIILRALVELIGWQVTLYMAAVAGALLTALIWSVVRDKNPDSYDYYKHSLDFKSLLKGLVNTLKNPQIWLNGLVGFLLYVSLSAFAELWNIPFLEQARAFSKTHAANANSMIFLGWAVGGPFWGWFSDLIQKRRTPIMVASFFSLALSGVILYFPHLPLVGVYILLFVFGLLSSVQILVFSICREATPIKIAGTAIAITNTFVMIGGNLFQPVIGKLLDLGWEGSLMHGARVYSPLAYQWALSVIPCCIAIAIIITFFLKETFGQVKS